MSLPACCTDFVIVYPKLFFRQYRTEEEQKFLEVHGVLDVPLGDLQVEEAGDLMIKIRRRCNQLGDDGLCRIYPNRPQVCREFDCATRTDCDCHGKGRIA